jgi:hypothetical protein
MKNRDYYNNLDPQLRDMFKESFCAQRPEEDFHHFLDGRYRSLFEFYGAAFRWNETPQGHDFWAALANQDGSFRSYAAKRLLKAFVFVLGLYTLIRILYHIIT